MKVLLTSVGTRGDMEPFLAIGEILRHNRSIYTISPSLFPIPDEWGDQHKVLGYHNRGKPIDWQPDNALLEFLKKHPKILFITFGSMINPAPETKTGTIVGILERNHIPAIINTASGGLVKPDHYDSGLIHFVSQIPYEWIFPRVYAVIHHGGSGTTHLGLKYGCATMIIPHIIDQFVWNRIVYRKGAGPRGMKIGRIDMKNLEPRILDLFDRKEYKECAEKISGLMASEDLEEELVRSIID